jgi:hypothetical protein
MYIEACERCIRGVQYHEIRISKISSWVHCSLAICPPIVLKACLAAFCTTVAQVQPMLLPNRTSEVILGAIALSSFHDLNLPCSFHEWMLGWRQLPGKDVSLWEPQILTELTRSTPIIYSGCRPFQPGGRFTRFIDIWLNMSGLGLNLLSLDGGGVRGLSSLRILQQVMEHINPKIHPSLATSFTWSEGLALAGESSYIVI